MPDGLRSEARYCSKRCRQASSRFELTVKRTAATSARPSGPGDVVVRVADADGSEHVAGRRGAKVLDDASCRGRAARAMRFAYAAPPYPGKAGYYPEHAEVDHQALVERLVADFEDGWALSTSAEALPQVLALCPAAVRVCAWHRAVRPTRSRRPISAWEPLIVDGGRELALDEPQIIRDALAYGGRFRAFPGAITGMKPPQFAVWMFGQLGARGGDELVDLYPGSGAIGEAWRRYAGVDEPAARDTSTTADVGERSDRSPVGQPTGRPSANRGHRAPSTSRRSVLSRRSYVRSNGARCESIAGVDVGCTAADANVDAGRAV